MVALHEKPTLTIGFLHGKCYATPVVKLLDGAELAGYIKAEQAREVRSLVQGKGVRPQLVILQDDNSKLNSTYARLKQAYAADIGVICELVSVDTDQLVSTIKILNKDDAVHGIIVQLPIKQPESTQEVVDTIIPAKDVDGLGKASEYDSATAKAILWLLSGYNIDLRGKTIAVIGQGRLVGQPVSDLLESTGVQVERYDEHTEGLQDKVSEADIVISATGQPGSLETQMIKNGAVVVDAGTASEGNSIVGDAAEELYERDDLTITPKKGGVGPLTVAALFGNVLQAARARVSS